MNQVVIKIIEVSHFTLCNHIRFTMYFINGKRVSQNSYYNWLAFSEGNYKHLGSEFYSKTEGLRHRDYTVIRYQAK